MSFDVIDFKLQYAQPVVLLDEYDEYIEVDDVTVNKVEWEKGNHYNATKDASIKHESPMEDEEAKENNAHDSTIPTTIVHKRLVHTRAKLKAYKCDQCDYRGKTKTLLKSHKKNMHLSEDKVNWFKCDHCDYKTKWKRTLQLHRIAVHVPDDKIEWYQCDHCGYRAKVKRNLQRHMAVHFSPDKITWFNCDQCNYRAERSSKVVTHKKAVHLPRDRMVQMRPM